jgi:hypothetical protein
VPGGDSLSDRAPGVVADQRDVVEVQGGQEAIDEVGQAREAEVDVRADRMAVRAHRQCRRQTAVAVGEVVDDAAPQGRGHVRAGQKDDGNPEPRSS